MRGTIRPSPFRVKCAAVVGYSDGFITDITTPTDAERARVAELLGREPGSARGRGSR